MSFFYDLNKKLDSIRATPEVTHQQLNERDMSRAAKGYEKYGKQGMQALAKAGREGKALDPVRKKYDKYDNKQVDEGGEIVDGVYKLAIEPKRPEEAENKMTRGTRPRTAAPGFGKDDYKPLNPDAMKKGGNSMGTIKGGVWTADPPKPGERGVPAPSGDPEGVKEAGMTSKQKSFAKLAPPADKITFADKIAGAKKEVDEMLGDVAAEAMRSALGGGRGRNAEMDEDNAFDYKSPRKDAPRVGSVERGHKHDIKHTATGRMVTRRTDDQGISVGSETDDEGNRKEKRTKAGRPDGTGKKIGAKGPSGKSKLMTKEGEDDPAEKGEYDREGDMALDDIDTIESAANELQSIIDADDNLPEWVQSKINKAMDYLDTARDYMAAQGNDQEPIAEKAVSKQQQKFMGMAHAMQKGEKVKGASKELKKVAKSMKPKDVEDFAKTKHKGLPDKVNKKEVDENSEDGRLTTTQTGAGKTSTSSSTGRISATVDKGTVSVKPAKSGGMSYGKGIYDSFNRDLEQMIAESMSINMSDSTEGNKSLTVTATDDDAIKLAMMLKSAGLGGGDMHSHSEQPCPTCGMPDCGCGDMQEAVDENAPDYPTNTQTSSNALQYAGGLNKPKTDVAGDGQTTVPNTAVHTQEEDALRRMMEMAGLAEDNMPMVKKDGKMVPAFAADGKGKNDLEAKDKEDDTVDESIRRMMEIAGVKKKPVDEEKTEEGNLFTKGLKDDDIKIGDKIPGTNAIKKKDIDESIFTLTNQWRTYKG